jgi:predicted RNase H-like HicB family nuclease
MEKYHINIYYSADDKTYIADIPDLRPCSARGRTPHEALEQVRIVRDAWIEAARANDRPIPEPRYRPAIGHRG